MVSTSRYEAQDVAKAADVAPAFVSRLVELGVVPPDQDGGFSSGDVRRIRLMKTLDRAGVPLDGVAQVIRRSELSLDFLDLPEYERLSANTEDTFEELAQEKGVPVELLMMVREAIGLGEPDPHDRVRETEMPVIRLIQAQVAEDFANLADVHGAQVLPAGRPDAQAITPLQRRMSGPARKLLIVTV